MLIKDTDRNIDMDMDKDNDKDTLKMKRRRRSGKVSYSPNWSGSSQHQKLAAVFPRLGN